MLNRRFSLFLGLAACFAAAYVLLGLPYGHFSWANKAWAQQVYTQTGVVAPPLAVVPTGPQAPLDGIAGDVPFVGRADTNGDGIIDENDQPTVFVRPQQSGAEPIAMPLAAEVTDVLAVDLNPQGTTGAYVGSIPGGTLMEIVPFNGGPTVEVAVPTLVSPLIHFSSLYVVNNNNNNNIPTLYSIDPETGDVLYERSLTQSNTQVSFPREGDYMLAYTPTSRLVRIFNLLSESDPLSLLVTGNISAAPQWSPQGSRLFYIMEEPRSRVELLNLVDAATVQTSTITLPDYPDSTRLYTRWSRAGNYVTVYALGTDGTLTANTPLSVVRASDAYITTFDVPGLAYTAVDWSADDRYLMVTETTLNTALTKLMIFDTATGVVVPLPLENRVPLRAAWHPTEARVGIFAEAGSDTYEVLLYDVADATLTPVHQVALSPFDTASLTWLADGEALLLLATAQDPLSQLLNAQTVSLLIDAVSGEAQPFLPEGVTLEP